jgi:hypothetical protein
MFSDRPLTPGPQGADAAHDQVDGDAGLRGLVERLDDLRLEQRVHLGDDAHALAGAGVGGFGADGGQHGVVQGERRQQEVVELAGLAQAGELLEDFVDVGARSPRCR